MIKYIFPNIHIWFNLVCRIKISLEITLSGYERISPSSSVSTTTWAQVRTLLRSMKKPEPWLFFRLSLLGTTTRTTDGPTLSATSATVYLPIGWIDGLTNGVAWVIVRSSYSSFSGDESKISELNRGKEGSEGVSSSEDDGGSKVVE